MEKQSLVSLDTQLGPWAGYLNAYTKLIKERGYSPASFQSQVQLIKRFNKWLRRGHTEISALDEIVVERFLHRRQSAGSARRGDAATLYRFLHVLRDQGASRRPKKPPLSPKQRLTANYGRYLLEERGLTQATVINYVPFIDQFLFARFQQSPCKLSQLRARDVTDFVRCQAHKFSPGCAQLLVTALRSFLRYLRYRGKITTDLNDCVPTVARWSFATLPKFLPAGTVQRVLDRNNRTTSIGRRDYAILLLLARLGLRACEIVALNLEDIDWENARIKGRTENALLRVSFKAVFLFRPAYIQPLHGIRTKTRWYGAAYALMRPIYPLWKMLFPSYVTTTECLGRAILSVAKRGFPKPVLENRDINEMCG
jgi:integrase/recombinase XerD